MKFWFFAGGLGGRRATRTSLLIAAFVSLILVGSPGAFAASAAFSAPVMLQDIEPGALSSLPREYLPLRDRVLFLVDGDTTLRQIWVSDGTAGGTRRLTGMPFDVTGAHFWLLGPRDESFVFVAARVAEGIGLYWTDGNPGDARSLLPEGVWLSQYMISPTQYWPERRLLLFWAFGPDGTADPWASDGTPTGTRRLFDTGTAASYPHENFVLAGSMAYFLRADESSVVSIWGTDGTAAGTVLIPGGIPNSVHISSLHGSPGGSLFWISQPFPEPNFAPATLWRSRAGGAPTALTSILALDPYAPTPVQLRQLGDRVVVFTPGGEILIADDSSPAAARLPLADSGLHLTGVVAHDSSPRSLRGRLLFFANDGVHGLEPWSTDGTVAGTVLLFDSCAGSCDSALYETETAGGFLFDRQGGEECHFYWSTGTPGSTFEVTGPAGSGCFELGQVIPADFGRNLLLIGRGEGSESYQLWNFDTRSRTLSAISTFATPDSQGWWLETGFGIAGAKVGRHFVFTARDGNSTGLEPWALDAWPDPCAA